MKGIRIDVALLVCAVSFFIYGAGRLLLYPTTTLKDLIEDSYLTTVNMMYFACIYFVIKKLNFF